jgi:hypothetical protein
MKNTSLLIAFLITIAVCVMPMSVQAQTATYQTVTSAALTQNATCFTVASTTSMHASGDITGPNNTPQEWDAFVDGEWMKINTLNTTTNQMCVQRGKSPTRAGVHATGSIVFVGPAGPSPFVLGAPVTNVPGPTDDKGQFGTCTSTNYLYLPLINVTNGSVLNCLTSARGGKWINYSFKQWTSGHPTTNIVDAAYTATLADEFINYNSLTNTRILTLPSITGVLGKTIVVVNGGLTSQTITITPVNNQTIGPAAATTLALAGPGNVSRLVSVLSSTGAYVWATW